MQKKTFFGLIFSLVSAICLTLVACSSDSQPLKIDSPAPGFELSDLNGQRVSLKEFRGKTVFINFWATTCGPCVSEMPVLQEFSSSLSGREVVFISINTGEDINVVKDFIQKNQYTFPVLLDSQYKVAGQYNVRYIPTSFFIDKDGLLKINLVGPFKDKTSIEKQLASFLP